MMTEIFLDEALPFEFRPMREEPVGSGNLVPAEVDAASVALASANETRIQVVLRNATNNLIEGTVRPIMPTPDGEPGTDYTVTADADMTAGVHQITGFGNVIVKARPGAMATTFQLTELPPVPLAPTPTPV
jgi:hypothetical protein